MPRLDLVESPDDEQARLLAKTLHGPGGQPLNLFRALVHFPELMRRVNALGGYFFVHSTIELRDRELVILRTAGYARSIYEIGQHRWLGREAGLSSEEIEAAIDPERAHGWSPHESRLFAFVDELLARDTVSDATWDALEDWGDVRRVELLVLVGCYRLLAGVLNGLEIELDPDIAS